MEKIILADSDSVNMVKENLPADLVKAQNAVFYMGDTGLDGKLVAHIGGNMHSVISLMVSAGMQNEAIRHLILVSATHLK